MSVRMNLSIGDELDKWITEKANSLGIAKNAFVIMCVANARQSEQHMALMRNSEVFDTINAMIEHDKKEDLSKA